MNQRSSVYKNIDERYTAVSSKSVSNSESSSSLHILDFNTLPDARKSVSLIPVSNKASCISNWLNNWSVEEENESNQTESLKKLDFQSLEKSSGLNSITSQELHHSEFVFNADEIDIDHLINEDKAKCTLTNKKNFVEELDQMNLFLDLSTAIQQQGVDNSAMFKMISDEDEIEGILNKEEDIIAGNNQFKIFSDDIPKMEEEKFDDFSECKVSGMILDEGGNGEISIGMYMAKHSEVLGKLNGNTAYGRPNFGLEIHSPLQQPCNLIDASTIKNNTTENSKNNPSILLKSSQPNNLLEPTDGCNCFNSLNSESFVFAHLNENCALSSTKQSTFFSNDVNDKDSVLNLHHLLRAKNENANDTLKFSSSSLSDIQAENSYNSFKDTLIPSKSFNSPTLNNIAMCKSNDECQKSKIDKSGAFPGEKETFYHTCQYFSRNESIVELHKLLCEKTSSIDQDINIVKVPAEFLVEYPLCAGITSEIILPLQSKSSFRIQVFITCLSLTIDDNEALLKHNNYISLKSNFTIGPFEKDDLNVCLTGHEPGKYLVKLKVCSTVVEINKNSDIDSNAKSVSFVLIYAKVCFPAVSLSQPKKFTHDNEKQVLEIGEISYGSSKSLPILLFNQSKFDIPICVLLCVPKKENLFFAISLTLQMDKNLVASNSLSSFHTILKRSPHPLTVWLHIMAKHHLPHENSLTKISGQINILLDLPRKSIKETFRSLKLNTVLDHLPISGVVGFSKLHAPKNKQLLTFTSPVGAKDQKKIPIRNAGNITIEVVFFLSQHSDFSIEPSNATLLPGENIFLSVVFAPVSSNKCQIQSIFMNILPCGPQFQIRIFGIVLPSSNSFQFLPASSSLQTNKMHLQWDGVAIGKMTKQNLKLRITGNKFPIQCQCSIKGKSMSSFQIIKNIDGIESFVKTTILTIYPAKNHTLIVAFAPIQKNVAQGQLEIKTPVEELPATKYTIPLTGFGGTNQLQIKDLKMNLLPISSIHNALSTDCYNLNVNSLSTGIEVSNIGSRSAFVKVLTYKDSSLQLLCNLTICSPSEFVLKENQSRKVSIKLAKSFSDFIYICIWCGNEITRKLLKNFSKTRLFSTFIHHYSQKLSFDISSFTQDFDGEDDWQEDDEINKIQTDFDPMQLFCINVKKIILQLKRNMNEKSAINLNTTADLSYFDLPVKDIGFTSNINTNAKVTSLTKQQEWYINPSHVTLHLFPTNKNNFHLPKPLSLVLQNKMMSSLSFDVVWPGHYLTVTPQQGIVESKSVLQLLVNANPSLLSMKNELPWCGQIIVLATNGNAVPQSYSVFVQIKQVIETTDSSVSTKIQKNEVEKDNKIASNFPKIVIFPNIVEFLSASVGDNSRSFLEICNLSLVSITWILTLLASTYSKNLSINSHTSSSVLNEVFTFPCKSGQLEPGAKIKLLAIFTPKFVGDHSECWEITYHSNVESKSALFLQKEVVHLKGEGIKLEGSIESKILQSSSSVSQSLQYRNDVYVSESCFWFPDTSILQSSSIKIPIKNKGKVSQLIKFVSPHSPFYISHTKHVIRSMCCANLPVTFKPLKTGCYSDVFKIQTTSGFLEIKLKATAIEP